MFQRKKKYRLITLRGRSYPFLLFLLLYLSFRVSFTYAQTVIDRPVPPLEQTPVIQQSPQNQDKLLVDALQQLPAFFNAIPGSIQRILIITIEKGNTVRLDPLIIKQRIKEVFLKFGRFQIVECNGCFNNKMYLEDKSIAPNHLVDTDNQMIQLSESMRIDAYLQAAVHYNNSAGKLVVKFQFIKGRDNTIIKKGNLFSASLPKRDKPSSINSRVQDENLDSSDLNLDRFFPRLIQKIPPLLSGLPKRINRVVLFNPLGDGIFEFDHTGVKRLMEDTFVNKTNLRVVECQECIIWQTQMESEKKFRDILNEEDFRMRFLSHQVGFDAYIISNVRIHEERKQVELNLIIVSVKENTIIKTLHLVETDVNRSIVGDSEHSTAVIPFTTMNLKGDYAQNQGVFEEGEASGYVGLQYRYLTTTLFEHLLTGMDFELYAPTTKNESDNQIESSLYNLAFFSQYRLPFELANHRLINVGLGYGLAGLHSKFAHKAKLFVFELIKLEVEFVITSSLSFGITGQFIGEHELQWNESVSDSRGDIPKQTFKGDSMNFSLRYAF